MSEYDFKVIHDSICKFKGKVTASNQAGAENKIKDFIRKYFWFKNEIYEIEIGKNLIIIL